jgi:hypothetical protein
MGPNNGATAHSSPIAFLIGGIVFFVIGLAFTLDLGGIASAWTRGHPVRRLLRRTEDGPAALRPIGLGFIVLGLLAAVLAIAAMS